MNNKELELLSQVFKDLALRNSSFDYLEKSIFLSFFKIPVLPTQGLLGERFFVTFAEDEEFTMKIDKFTQLLEIMCRDNNSSAISTIFEICDLDSTNSLSHSSFKLLVIPI